MILDDTRNSSYKLIAIIGGIMSLCLVCVCAMKEKLNRTRYEERNANRNNLPDVVKDESIVSNKEEESTIY